VFLLFVSPAINSLIREEKGREGKGREGRSLVVVVVASVQL